MLSYGFTRNKADPCFYMKKENRGNPIILVLYVDDMLIGRKHKTTLKELKLKLNSSFSMKDLIKAENILGTRIGRDRQKKLLFLSQESTLRRYLIDFR